MRFGSQDRRTFLRQSFASAGLLAFGTSLMRCTGDETTESSATTGGGGGGGAPPANLVSNIANLGPLGDADPNGVRLPAGFTSRILAQSGMPVAPSAYAWHGAPDGGAVFSTPDGWIYVSNSELGIGAGGAGALRFSMDGEIVDAYAILEGTTRNCAGGPTPWGTWLSCEEADGGQVWECDPTGAMPAVARPAMGQFHHEACAIDPNAKHAYLTEDEPDGRLYRFTPASYPDLGSGTLEVLRVVAGEEGATEWLPVPDPSGSTTATRLQVPESTAFDGGEGIWFHEGIVYFSTKGDNRIWAYDTADGMLSIVYDVTTSPMPILSGVDNVVVSPGGDVLVAEDGGDLQIVALTPDGKVVPLMQLVGHDSSEITGPAFDPTLGRLYFSSQRGTAGSGVTFEISGPFFVEG